MPPMPGGSPEPRANTTSTSGHGSAPAAGAPGIGATQSAAAAVRTVNAARTWKLMACFLPGKRGFANPALPSWTP